jgi:multimeric flavodoxin WrbA
LKRVDYATVYDFISCDAVAFGSPNYFSYMAGLMKDFFDKALSVREKVAGKATVAFTSGGGSSDSALLSLERMISSFRLQKVSHNIVSSGLPSKGDLEKCKKAGETLAKAALKRAIAPKK